MNIKIDEALIRQVARNSNLELSEDEVKKFKEDFKDVLENFSMLQELDVTNVVPSFHPIPVKNKIREDIIEKSLPEKEVFENVTISQDKFIRGPKVV